MTGICQTWQMPGKPFHYCAGRAPPGKVVEIPGRVVEIPGRVVAIPGRVVAMSPTRTMVTMEKR